MLSSGAISGFRRNPNKKYAKISRQLRKYLGVDHQRTPNMLEILSKLKATIPRFRLKIVPDGNLAKIEAWTNSATCTIYLTELVLKGLLYGNPRARFTVAHEVGHLVFQHDKKHFRKARKRYTKDKAGRLRLANRKQEREANKFASRFLMPAHLVLPADTVDDISKKFHVSKQAARIRLDELKKCSGQEDFGWDDAKFFWEMQDGKAALDLIADTRVPAHCAVRGFAFVAMDFEVNDASFYEKAVKPIVKECGLECRRGDEFRQSGTVFIQIQNAIRDSAILVADLTGCNGNVIMEIGMALSLDKPTVMICRKDTQDSAIPYNLRHLRRIPYTEDAAGGLKLREELIDAIQAELTRMQQATTN